MSLDVRNGVEGPGGAQIGREDLDEWVQACRQLREFLELHIAEMDRARRRRRLAHLFFAAFLVTSVVLCWAWRGVGRPRGDDSDSWAAIDVISVRYKDEAVVVGPAARTFSILKDRDVMALRGEGWACPCEGIERPRLWPANPVAQ